MADKRREKPKLKLKTALFKGSFIHNPVLTQAIGLCPIVAAATTVRNSLSLSFMLMLLLLVNEGLTSLFLKKLSRWIRVAVYTLVSSVVVALFDSFAINLSSDSGAGLGIYLYLLSVNALIVIRCEQFAARTTLRNSLTDAFACSLGYGAVALIVGAVREFITYGTVMPSGDVTPKISAAALPFVALVILGFLAAMQKAYILKFHPTEETDTFSLQSAEDKVLLKDPGLGQKKPQNKKRRFDEDSFDAIRPRYTIEDVVIEREGDDNA